MEPMIRKEINLDTVLKELGPYGNYNKLNFALLLFPILLSGFYECGYIFEAPPIDYRCEIPECEGIRPLERFYNFTMPSNETCERFVSRSNGTGLCSPEDFHVSATQRCDRFVYESPHSVVAEFGLGCEEWRRTLVGTVHNSGMFVALLLTGSISDRFGRTVALALSCLANFVFGVARSFVSGYELYTAMHFLESGFGGGLYTSCFVLAVELVEPNQRVLVTPLFNITFVVGLIILAALAWALDNWRILLLSLYSPAILVAVYACFMKESARWLLSKGRRDDAIKVLESAAKMNNMNTEDLELVNLSSPLINNERKPDTKSEFSQVFKSTYILLRLASCSFLWVSCTFVYYGMSINSVTLDGNKFINFILVVLVEIPANLLVIVMLDKYGRKKTIIATFLTSGLMCLSFSLLPKETGWWSLALYLLGKSSVTLTYSSVYVYVSEVFPTSLRQTLISICSTIGRFGSLVAPLTPLLSKYYHSLPSLMFGAMCVAASVVMMCSPETNHTRLPDTIEEAERLSRTRGSHRTTAA